MKKELNSLTQMIIGAAIEVHKALGPGLLESVYEQCLDVELKARGLKVQRQRVVPVTYRGVQIENAYRVDLLVEDSVVVEVKSVEALDPIFEAQLLTYLRLGGWRVGLMINFNVEVLRNGIRRRVLNFQE